MKELKVATDIEVMPASLQQIVEDWNNGKITRADAISFLCNFTKKEVDLVSMPLDLKVGAERIRKALSQGKEIYSLADYYPRSPLSDGPEYSLADTRLNIRTSIQYIITWLEDNNPETLENYSYISHITHLQVWEQLQLFLSVLTRKCVENIIDEESKNVVSSYRPPADGSPVKLGTACHLFKQLALKNPEHLENFLTSWVFKNRSL